MEEELVHDEVGGGEGEGGEDEGPPAAQEVGEQAAWGAALEGGHGGRWVGGVKDRRWEGTPSNTYQAAEDTRQGPQGGWGVCQVSTAKLHSTTVGCTYCLQSTVIHHI